MAYVAFDLDNTLGYFDITNHLANFWSPELLVNPDTFAANPYQVPVSQRLVKKLQTAISHFVKSLLGRKDLLWLLLRTDLDGLIVPLLQARKARKVAGVIMYSNSMYHGSLQLARTLIERHYRCPGLFQLLADAYHPLRDADQPEVVVPNQYYEQYKTFPTLARLFDAAGVAPAGGHVMPSEVVFVDDRKPKHVLQNAEPYGLQYVMPSHFKPHMTRAQKGEFLKLAVDALDSAGVLKDQEYLGSAFCHRGMHENFTGRKELRGFPDLYAYVKACIDAEDVPRGWHPDSYTLHARMTAALKAAYEAGKGVP